MMRKIISLVLALLICVCMTTAALAAVVPAVDDTVVCNVSEKKVHSNATIEDNFAEDRILVVLSNSASLEFRAFQTDAFAEINCIAVENLSQSSEIQVKARLEALGQNDTVSTYALTDIDIAEIEAYNQILSLKLAEPGKQNVLDAIDILMSRDDVIYAGPDYIYSVQAVDVGTLEANSLVEELIDLPEAWELTTGSETVWVGVIDTGIDATHPDLADAVDVSLSGDFRNETRVLGISQDTNGHGTHVAGIIAAARNSTQNTGGVAPNVKLISLKFNSGSIGYSSAVQRAINYAQEIGIDILNFSGGWIQDSDQYDYALNTAIENYSGLFVCAAGNYYNNNDLQFDYPSSYDLPNLMSVASSDYLDNKAASSNYGQTTVDIFAPGVNIKSTLLNGTYGVKSGTSMAAPYVTGVAALMLSLCPDLTPGEIIQKIMTHADGVAAFSELCVSGARLNAYRPLLYVHTWQYGLHNISYHRVYCSCGEEKLEAHTWTELGAKYKCSICGYITGSLPGIIQGLNQAQAECAACVKQ